MLSRVAAHLYWMSRYLERAENMARILDVTQSLAMLDRSADSGGAMTPIVITEAQAEFAATNLPATYENVVALRAVSTDDYMTADWSRLPHDFLARTSTRIINSVKGVNRVVYDISSKPPATIEWE